MEILCAMGLATCITEQNICLQKLAMIMSTTYAVNVKPSISSVNHQFCFSMEFDEQQDHFNNSKDSHMCCTFSKGL